MTEQEYFLKLDELIRKVKEGVQFEVVCEEMEELYCFKPVRLTWFVLKGQVMLRDGVPLGELCNIIYNKVGMSYVYPGIKKYFELRSAGFQRDGLLWDQKKDDYYKLKLNGCGKTNMDCELENAIRVFMEDTDKAENRQSLAVAYYHVNNLLMAIILVLEQVRIGFMHEDRKHWLYSARSNFLYIEERIWENKENTFILIADDDTASDCIVLAEILHGGFGHKVFLLTDAVTIELANPIPLSETLQTSLDYVELYDDAIVIKPVEIVCGGVKIGDNREYIIDYICRNETNEDLATVICSGQMLDDLCNRPYIQKRMDRLMPFEAEYMEDRMYFGWAGSYLSYISSIYCYDVRAEIDKQNTCDFSIVIPVRNHVYTLRHTLRTCLEQRYSGSYEIILSDNSTDGNTAVYDLYREFDDKRIKYYKTPRNLTLAKSFEFAYLKAGGEFVFSIGSDDGIFPWTLEVLAKVLEQYPNEMLIQWERGFYGWPGLNGTQDNQFVIPNKYKKDNYGIYFKEKIEYLAEVTKYTQNMYTLPLLYINSGMRRSYIPHLYEKTGRLWDGCNQDIYIGVINASINERILNLRYPLTLAGMSNSSLGLMTSIPINDDPEKKKIADSAGLGDNVGIYVLSVYERTIPPIYPSSTTTLYLCLLRAVTRNILPKQLITDAFDLKKIYLEMFASLSRKDLMFDYYLHMGKFYADKQGEEFAKWFNDAIYIPSTKPHYYNETENQGKFNQVKSYQEDYNEVKGCGTLDASRYSVSNIEEACKLFAELTSL